VQRTRSTDAAGAARMRTLRAVRTLVQVTGVLAVLAIGIVPVVPGDYRPHLLPASRAEHALVYTVSAALLYLGYRDRIPAAWIIVGLAGYGAVLEVCQLWVPSRTGKPTDEVANLVGTFNGCLDRARCRPQPSPSTDGTLTGPRCP
jgi:VanZ family protein